MIEIEPYGGHVWRVIYRWVDADVDETMIASADTVEAALLEARDSLDYAGIDYDIWGIERA